MGIFTSFCFSVFFRYFKMSIHYFYNVNKLPRCELDERTLESNSSQENLCEKVRSIGKNMQ